MSHGDCFGHACIPLTGLFIQSAHLDHDTQRTTCKILQSLMAPAGLTYTPHDLRYHAMAPSYHAAAHGLFRCIVLYKNVGARRTLWSEASRSRCEGGPNEGLLLSNVLVVRQASFLGYAKCDSLLGDRPRKETDRTGICQGSLFRGVLPT